MTQYAYHLLCEQQHGKAEIQRVDENNVVVHLSEEEKIVLPIDYREKKTLVVFDGFLVEGGLPKNHDIIICDPNSFLAVRKENVFKPIRKTGVHVVSPTYTEYHDTFEVVSRRYFILLPSCRAVVFRYRPKSLSPQGVVIEVEKGKVRFLTTTY